MKINLETLTKMEQEVKRFQESIKDAKARVKLDLEKYYNKDKKDCRIEGTAESSMLKSSFKVMTYQVNKIFKEY